MACHGPLAIPSGPTGFASATTRLDPSPSPPTAPPSPSASPIASHSSTPQATPSATATSTRWPHSHPRKKTSRVLRQSASPFSSRTTATSDLRRGPSSSWMRSPPPSAANRASSAPPTSSSPSPSRPPPTSSRPPPSPALPSSTSLPQPSSTTSSFLLATSPSTSPTDRELRSTRHSSLSAKKKRSTSPRTTTRRTTTRLTGESRRTSPPLLSLKEAPLPVYLLCILSIEDMRRGGRGVGRTSHYFLFKLL
mmetsp:Transcript_20823/g.67045  ORF Transcript_20823/g.67045 Transcript_20823/m.67045 type:complete len:251 (+) Transcript_20823:1112-1864(+)